MASKRLRVIGITTALLNRDATPEQVERLGRALAHRCRRLAEYDGSDEVGKYSIYLQCIRALLLSCMQDLEQQMAIRDAQEMARMTASADFQETP